MKQFLALLTLCMATTFGVAAAMKTDNLGNPHLSQYSEEGFIDCVLRIVERSETPTHYILTLRAVYEGQVVGFSARVVKGIQAGLDSDASLIQAHVYRNGVTFMRTGPESDRLIAVIARLYGEKSRPLRMSTQETYTAIALHQGTINMVNQPVKLKLFGRDAEPIDNATYYESFFNIDLRAGFVFWNEKDQDYRRALIRALGE
jgi:hypothetical protein